MATIKANGNINGHELKGIEVVNPGDWFGKTWLIEIGGSYSSHYLIVEADSMSDAIDELADSEKHNHHVVVEDEHLDDYPEDIPRKYGCGIAVCGSLLSVEHVGGMIVSQASVVPGNWSHVAGVFTEGETRLYLNGKLVATGPGSSNDETTKFVIGNVGETNYGCYYRGQIRSVRISKGERFGEAFEPQELTSDDLTIWFVSSPSNDGDHLLNLNNERIGQVERLATK